MTATVVINCNDKAILLAKNIQHGMNKGSNYNQKFAYGAGVWRI
ncbi:hypothetical protein [Spartinivicinus ruber]|nr:hypothetical protein [Spartinivicinus ruber]